MNKDHDDSHGGGNRSLSEEEPRVDDARDEPENDAPSTGDPFPPREWFGEPAASGEESASGAESGEPAEPDEPAPEPGPFPPVPPPTFDHRPQSAEPEAASGDEPADAAPPPAEAQHERYPAPIPGEPLPEIEPLPEPEPLMPLAEPFPAPDPYGDTGNGRPAAPFGPYAPEPEPYLPEPEPYAAEAYAPETYDPGPSDDEPAAHPPNPYSVSPPDPYATPPGGRQDAPPTYGGPPPMSGPPLPTYGAPPPQAPQVQPQAAPIQPPPAQPSPAQPSPAQPSPAQPSPAQPPQQPPGPYPQPPRSPYEPPSAYQPARPAYEPSTENADSLSPANLLRGRKQPPAGGWRRAIYKASGGIIHPGESAQDASRRERLVRVRTPVVGGHHRVAVMSLKGGVGKTTTTVGLGATLASLRGDRVIAVDANPDRGTLSDKVHLETAATVRDLLNEREQIQRYSDVRAFTSQAASRLEILASDRDPAVSEAFSEDDYRLVADVLEHFYSICLTDCGTGLLHSAMSGVLGLADQIVLVSSPSVDGARSASATLDWLEAHQYGDLVRSAVVVLSMVRHRSKSSVDLDRLEQHFLGRTRAVIRVPYDAHLEEGAELELDELNSATREAYLELAATVGDAFAWQR